MGRAYRGDVHTGFWRGNLRENHLQDTGVDGMIILKWIFETGVWREGMYRSRSGEGQVAGYCEYG